LIKRPNKAVSSSFFRLFAPIIVLLIPLLVLGGNVSTASPPLPQKASDTAKTLVLRVYFHDTAERDRLATELNAEEMPTTSGYLTVIADRSQYSSILAKGLRVEVDEASTAQMNNPNLFGHDNNPDTFDGGYRTVEEMQTFLD